LIIERLKGEKSFWKPFLDYLPSSNDTLFTIDPTTPIGQDEPNITLIGELQNPQDDIHRWIAYDKDINDKAMTRFIAYINEKFPEIQQSLARMDVAVHSPRDFIDLFEWASMNCATRCFGHAQVPNEICMCPLLDLVNHDQE
jgi:hypothetical protein